MTNKEIAERIDAVLNEQEPYGTIDVERLQDLRDELRPPRPEPGALVHYRKRFGHIWHIGLAYPTGVYSIGDNQKRQWEHIEWKPARILAPDEVAVKIPPVSGWPERFVAITWGFASYLSAPERKVITRAEAERMEAER